MAMLSVPDPDEAMDAHADELVEEHDLDLNNSVTISEDTGHQSGSPRLPEDQGNIVSCYFLNILVALMFREGQLMTCSLLFYLIVKSFRQLSLFLFSTVSN